MLVLKYKMGPQPIDEYVGINVWRMNLVKQ